MRISLFSLSAILLLSGCAFTESALKYANEGTRRVESGYSAKSEMTKEIMTYLIETNKDCGVKVEVINNIPVTTVKECVKASDVMASVDKVDIIEPQQVANMVDSASDFVLKATNLFVPIASIYYGYKGTKVAQEASVENTKSNNQANSSMWNAYTNNFNKTSNVDKSTTTTTTTTTPFMPIIETNSTKIWR